MQVPYKGFGLYLSVLLCIEISLTNLYTSKNLNWLTIVHRYTDFLVNEIAPDGSVVHLTDDEAPIFKAIAKVSFFSNFLLPLLPL